jgi:hypothetical protein
MDNNGQVAMVEVGGFVYNRDHIVKVDLRQEGAARIHTVLGCDEFEGQVARDIKAFFAAAPDPVVAPAAGREDALPAKRGKKG